MKYKVVVIFYFLIWCSLSTAENGIYRCGNNYTNTPEKETEASRCNLIKKFKPKTKFEINPYDELFKFSDPSKEDTEGTPEYKKKNEKLLKNFHSNLSKNKVSIAIPLIYGYADKFSEGLAVVSFGQMKSLDSDAAKAAWKTGYINKYGAIIISPYYDVADNFSNGIGRAKIANSEKVIEVYLNKQGKELLSKEYNTVKDKDTGKGTGLYLDTGSFSEGLKADYQYEGGEYKYGFVDISGKLVIPYIYDYASRFSEGFAIVGKKIEINGSKKIQYGFIDKSQNQVVNYKYDILSDFANGVATFSTNTTSFGPHIISGRFGLINKNGEVVAREQFLNHPIFSEGLAGVCIGEYLRTADSACGVIDTKGNFVVPPIFHVQYATNQNINILNFNEGLASYCEEVDGKFKCGFINRSGDKVIPAKYDYAGKFSEGLATVSIRVSDNGHATKTGYINQQGKMVIPAVFEDARVFNEGLAAVRVGDKWGYIRKP